MPLRSLLVLLVVYAFTPSTSWANDRVEALLREWRSDNYSKEWSTPTERAEWHINIYEEWLVSDYFPHHLINIKLLGVLSEFWKSRAHDYKSGYPKDIKDFIASSRRALMTSICALPAQPTKVQLEESGAAFTDGLFHYNQFDPGARVWTASEEYHAFVRVVAFIKQLELLRAELKTSPETAIRKVNALGVDAKTSKDAIATKESDYYRWRKNQEFPEGAAKETFRGIQRKVFPKCGMLRREFALRELDPGY